MRKILGIVMILALLAGAGLFAGGGSQGSTTTAAKDVPIQFMSWESPAMNAALLATFTTVPIPGVTVSLVPSPLQDYGIKVQEMLAAGMGPDVFLVGNDMALNFFDAGLTADITAKLQADQDFLKSFYTGSLTTYQVGGKYIGIPALINLYGIFYNKKYFDDAKIDYPKKDWTFADMLSIADKLKDTAKNRYGLYNKSNNAFQMSIYSASKDNTPFTNVIYPVTKVQASPAFIEGVQLVQNAIKNKVITPPTYDNTNVTGMFMQGAVPMMYYGQWAADELIRNGPADLKWGYVPHPRVNTNAQIFDMTGWAINKKTKNLDAAYKVLRHIQTDTYRLVLGNFPVAPSAYGPANAEYYKTLNAKGHQDLADGMEYMLNAQVKLPIRFLNTWAPKATAFLTADWNKFIVGDLPLTDIQSKIIDNINSVIK